MKSSLLITVAAALSAASTAALACSSCGCTLNSDWSTQGFKSGGGLSVDLRYDQFDQNDLRRGTDRVDSAALSLPADQEIQHRTVNRNTTLALDYGFADGWGLNLQLPWLNRHHTTFAEGDTELSTSASNSVGDMRIVGRWQGVAPERNWGLQFGLKLPTGATDVDFAAGPQAGQPLDRGLQPGTGSTDLLLGAYGFGTIAQHLDWFASALFQIPVTSRDRFEPGAGVNLSAGLRYVGDGPLVPHLQVNLRSEGKESGANADVPNSGATLAYLSPGLTWAVGDHLRVYGFVQLPIYQRVTGLQLEPRSSASIGLHYSY